MSGGANEEKQAKSLETSDYVFLLAMGKKIPSHLHTQKTCTVKGNKGEGVGIKLTSLMAISKVDRGSDADRLLQYGDLITHMNATRLTNRKHLESIFTELCKKNNYQIEFKFVRLNPSLPLKEKRLPAGFEQVTGYKYHVAVIYLIAGCKLALAVKSFNNKVYVTRANENTLASMSLSVGDAIIDVDSVPVTSVSDVTKMICSRLKSQGYVTVAIEQADDPVTAAYVRMVLMADKTMDIDLPLAPDAIDICRKALRSFSNNPNLKCAKSILRTKKHEERAKSSRIKVNEETLDIPVACEDNPNLLVKVPAAPPTPPWLLQKQQQQQSAAKN